MVDHALMPGAGAYYLDGSRDHCVVLVHGYTATPGELRLLGDELQQLNFKVMGVRLPGHGTTVQDLAKTTFRDWCDAVESDIQRARGLADQVTLVGSSMGAEFASRLPRKRSWIVWSLCQRPCVPLMTGMRMRISL